MGDSGSPDHLTEVNGKMFFSAQISAYYDGNGRELWVKENSSSRSRIVKDLNPNGDGIEADSQFFNLNGVLLFTGRSNNGGYKQLWRSDGTAESTFLVKIINPNYDARIVNSIIFGGKMYLNHILRFHPFIKLFRGH